MLTGSAAKPSLVPMCPVRQSASRRSVLRAIVSGGLAITSGCLGGGVGQVAVPGVAGEYLNHPGWAAKLADCTYPDRDPELFGPTALNAQSSNQSLTVGLDRSGTVTVLRWPRTSFYDHVKYRTRTRDRPRMGAHPNAGAFLGLVVETEDGGETTWLRTWTTEQRYLDPFSDTILTRHRSGRLGLTVHVRDVVAWTVDAFVRRVDVRRDDDSPVARARLLAFENCNLVTTRYPFHPTRDWCEEGKNDDRARYDSDADVIVHDARGEDESTGFERRVAIAMGFAGPADDHQVGGDAFEPSASVRGTLTPTLDAYLDAADGRLLRNDEFVGQTTGALASDLSFEDGVASERVVFAAGETADEAATRIERARQRSFEDVRREKRDRYGDLLSDAPLPATDDEDVLAVARRALVTMVSNYDPRSGAIVASIATQSPYALDWIRDGAYFNYVLDRIGLEEWVDRRNRWYASIQRTADDAREGSSETPPGNWAMAYYGDGVPGGPIPYEIDETGYGIWTLWDHYRVTDDRSYLLAVYPAIRRAANYLCDCRDPATGLHCPAPEDDDPVLRRTVVGAGPVWLGLDSAVAAADALGRFEDAERWTSRRDELGEAIDEYLWDPEVDAYCKRAGTFDRAIAALAWPVEFEPADPSRMDRHLAACWERVEPAFAEPERGDLDWGLYETKVLLAIAKTSDPDSEWMDHVRDGLDWVATRHATPGTRVLGETWIREGEEILSAVSQPHAWEQVLFYLAALEAYPPDGW